MTITVTIPGPGGGQHVLHEGHGYPAVCAPSVSREAYAAAHVVANPLTASMADSGEGTIDWSATLRIRERIWDLGLGVAEAMDTAQRGMGLPWSDAQTLIDLTLTAGRARNAATVVGVSTDQLPENLPASLEQITQAYIEQVEFVEQRGGTPVLMASRWLAATARTADDYLQVYRAVLVAARGPVLLHWLGVAFDARLEGYWGSTDLDVATRTVLDLIESEPAKIAGIKISLLDAAREVRLRRQLPAGVKLFTGDDFNYVDLIAGDELGHSHALLGAFAAITPIAAAALARLDASDVDGYRRILEPTLPLSRLVFQEPTQYYKTGVAWLSYLNGDQRSFRMIGGLDSGRNIAHLIELFVTANDIGLFRDPALTAHRLNTYLAAYGLA
ncbi:DUF993 family protein [Mycobacterium aquaticum]|uniref:Dihydrodipicolinate synthase family protein n=1 Tax=Mycobacterium aquaticum TaxID=1927124 RepID=A0A1X0BA03_9MYCO|nr:DUF993 family protein [Mycobacterium aquaticum]ORA39172.1 dihydrodipicolinate synthase family protein [Mycobacterium aquaticum]